MNYQFLIVGILIAGVTQGSILIKKSRLSAAQSLTQSSPVPSIKGLVAWYEATSKQSLEDRERNDGDSISKWYDRMILVLDQLMILMRPRRLILNIVLMD